MISTQPCWVIFIVKQINKITLVFPFTFLLLSMKFSVNMLKEVEMVILGQNLSLLLLRNIYSKCERADVKLFTLKQGEAFAVEWFLGNSRHKKDVN